MPGTAVLDSTYAEDACTLLQISELTCKRVQYASRVNLNMARGRRRISRGGATPPRRGGVGDGAREEATARGRGRLRGQLTGCEHG